MFFNLNTGETSVTGTNTSCWVADGNLWIAGYGMECSIGGISMPDFCDFLERARATDKHAEYHRANGGGFAMEDEDQGERNLCFYEGYMFFDINMKTENILALAKFLRTQTK
jgi:hypothetical protein